MKIILSIHLFSKKCIAVLYHSLKSSIIFFLNILYLLYAQPYSKTLTYTNLFNIYNSLMKKE